MKKILYLTMAPIDESSGVYKKIVSQASAFSEQGYECLILFVRDSSEAYVRNIDGKITKIDISDKFQLLKIKDYLKTCVFCYARFELLRHKYYREIILMCKKLSVKIISEIPTYPPYQESLARVKAALSNKRYLSAIKTLLGTILVIMDIYIMTLYSKLVVIVADDKKFLFADTVRIENGIDVESNPYQHKNPDEYINIIAVSNFSVWNGYDRAIVGLSNYVKETGKHDIKLIMVGDKSAGKSLIDQAERLDVLDDIEFTGSLSGKKLDEAYARADIALAALGNHRRNVFANSSLKVKEYASRGMLMVLSDAEGIEYEIKEKSLIVKSDESPLDLVNIIKWFESIKDKKNTSLYIHEFAQDNYSWDAQIKKILERL